MFFVNYYGNKYFRPQTIGGYTFHQEAAPSRHIKSCNDFILQYLRPFDKPQFQNADKGLHSLDGFGNDMVPLRHS
jgi:hypothetical protein